MMFPLILLSLTFYFFRDALRLLPGSWVKIVFDRDGVSVVTRDGRSVFGQIEKKTVVCPYLVVLGITIDGSHQSVYRVIFPDALEVGAFRELSVLLKFS